MRFSTSQSNNNIFYVIFCLQVTLSLAQYRNRKHNVSSPGISPTNDKLSLKDQNFSDEEQNMSVVIIQKIVYLLYSKSTNDYFIC